MMRSLLTLISLLSFYLIQAQFSMTTVPPLNGGNGSSGITFNVKARTADIIIDSLYNSFYGTASTSSEVWYKPGPINGSPNITTANGWIQLGTATLTPQGSGTSPVFPQLVDVPIGVTIPAGQTYGFFIGGNTVAYTTHGTASQDTFANSDITIYTGTNVGYGGPAPSPPNHPRQFNGTVFYSPAIKAGNDAGVASIDSPSAFCPGFHTIQATIKNFGINLINGVTVNWSLNGIPMLPVTYNGTLDTLNGTGNHTARVTLGAQNFIAGQVYTVRAWTTNPNGVADTNNTNDTITAILAPAINGTFTVGGASPDFATLSDAANRLNTAGVCGPTEFLVRPGTYNEQVAFGNISGASSVNTITFKSTTGDSSDVIVTHSITSSVDNYVILLDGSDYVGFEDMTFRASGVSWGTSVRLGPGNCVGNSFSNCEIEAGNGQTTSLNFSGVASDGGTHDDNVFENCYIHNCAYGYYWVTGGGSENVFRNNVVHSYYMGFRLDGHDSPEISFNTIESNTQGTYNFFYGMYMNGGSGSPVITNNSINSVTGAYGMYFGSFVADASNPGLVANNLVHVGGAGTAYGYYMTSTTSNIQFIHNTANITSTNTSAGRACYNASTGNGIAFYNNLFTNTGGGYAIYLNNPSSVDTSDYNAYFSAGSTLGFWGGTVSDLAALKTQNGMDVHSVSSDPGYLHAINDLRPTSGILNDKALYFPSLPNDFDGDPRNVSGPDIGAQEFEPLQNDIGALFFESPTNYGCNLSDSTLVTVGIANFGQNPQSNFQVSLKIFSVLVTTETVTATVNPGDTLYYTFNTTVNLSVPSIYPLQSWTSFGADQNNFNDSINFHPVFSDKYVRNFPYVMDFETSMSGTPQTWLNDPFDGTEDWGFSVANPGTFPAPAGIPGDHTTGNGYFAWVDNTSPAEAATTLLSPCLDFSNASNPFLEFYMYSADINNSIFLHIDVWSNNEWHTDIVPPLGYQSSTDWTYQLISLQQFAGQDAKIRFRAEETGSSSSFDLGLDDIKIFNLGPINTGVIDVLKPTSGCGLSDIEEVEVWIVQYGFDTMRVGETIPVAFSVDNGPELSETITLTQDLAQFDSVKYLFNNVADLSQTGDHVLRVWTDHPLDDDFTNDTLTQDVNNVLINKFPYVQDFESFIVDQDATGFEDNWYTTPENTVSDFRWNVHQFSTPSFGTGPDGDFDQNGDGKYLYTESSNGTTSDEAVVYTPCIDLTTISNPGFNFAYHMLGTTMGELHVDVEVNGTWINDIRPPFIGEQGGNWNETAVKLQAFQNQTVVLRFRALRGTSSASDMAIDAFRLGELPVVGFPDTIRSCGSVKLDAGNPGATYQWSTGQASREILVIGDQSNQIIQNVSVEVENAQGLKSWANTVVILDPGPVLDLGSDTLVCGSNSVTLDAGNPGMSYQWNDNSTLQTLDVTTGGTYSVEVDNGQGCVKRDTIDVTFAENPDANFSWQRDPASPNDISFTNVSDFGTSYLWDFGDGVYSTSANPKHFFQTTGVFPVKLIVYNECGADTLTVAVSTHPVGVEDLVGISGMEVSPNPAHESIKIRLSLEEPFNGSLTIWDVRGRVIGERALSLLPGVHMLDYDLGDIPAGVYSLVIQGERGSISRSIVRQ